MGLEGTGGVDYGGDLECGFGFSNRVGTHYLV